MFNNLCDEFYRANLQATFFQRKNFFKLKQLNGENIGVKKEIHQTPFEGSLSRSVDSQCRSGPNIQHHLDGQVLDKKRKMKEYCLEGFQWNHSRIC